MEAGAARSETPPPQVCRHWQRLGFCLYAERCRFLHLGTSAAATTQHSALEEHHEATAPAPSDASHNTTTTATSSAEGRRQAFAMLSNTRSQNRGAGRRNKIMNRSKAGSFRRWLEDTFGLDMLASGTGVLDIAGGKGELSFELVNLMGVHTTVIDPRPLRLDRYTKRLLLGIYHRTGPWQAYNHLSAPQDVTQVRKPDHIRTFFDDDLLSALEQHVNGDEQGASDRFQKGLLASRAVVWTEKGLTQKNGKEKDTAKLNQLIMSEDIMNEEISADDDDVGIVEWPIVQKQLMSCSVIIGLHPDQATDAIVDFALRWNKSFAIVPCCVYHKQFPRRRLNGKPVTSYEQLVAYILAKAPDRIKTAKLDFEGKNLVLYCITSSEPHHDHKTTESINTSQDYSPVEIQSAVSAGILPQATPPP